VGLIYLIDREGRDDAAGLPGDELLVLHDYLKERGNSLRYIDEESYLREKIRKRILERGRSECLTSSTLLLEEVLPDGADRNAIITTFQKMLAVLSPQKELLIIDRYLFAGKVSAKYLKFFCDLLGPSLQSIKCLRTVSDKPKNSATIATLVKMVKKFNKSIDFKAECSNVFHDRFWICDREKGLFVGTSLNGVGSKYAVVDYLQPEDVKKIYNRYRRKS
jgi:hypothetical protein